MDWLKTLVILAGLMFSSVAFAEKPSFIIFHTSWCGPCQKLEKDLAYDSNNLRKPLRLFVRDKVERAWLVDAETEQGRTLMKAYGVEDTYPAIVVGQLTDGKLRHTHIFYGYSDPDVFMQLVEQQ